jgi:hypothetical protein
MVGINSLPVTSIAIQQDGKIVAGGIIQELIAVIHILHLFDLIIMAPLILLLVIMV